MDARRVSETIFNYYEGVLFNHSRFRHFCCERSGGASTHSEERGEEHGDYSKERRA